MNIEGVGEGGGDDDGDMMIMRGCRTQPVNNVRFFFIKKFARKKRKFKRTEPKHIIETMVASFFSR
mgnify:CR=1 FL=1